MDRYRQPITTRGWLVRLALAVIVGVALATAEGNQARANQDLESAHQAEDAARERFHEAQNKK